MRFFWRWFWRSIAFILLLVCCYQVWVFLHIWYWVDHNPSTTAFMRQRLAVLRQEESDAKLQYRWVPYARISPALKRAVIAAEDAKFLDHEGFDWEGIQHAYEKNLKKGKIVAGGSTISQQLAKNLFLSGSRTPWRKAEEAVITLMLENIMNKRRILEIYLNVIEWGNGVFGAEAAAHHYFGVSAAQLSSAQAARLAAMVPNPRLYDRRRNARGLQRRAGIIAGRMRVAEVP